MHTYHSSQRCAPSFDDLRLLVEEPVAETAAAGGGGKKKSGGRGGGEEEKKKNTRAPAALIPYGLLLLTLRAFFSDLQGAVALLPTAAGSAA